MKLFIVTRQDLAPGAQIAQTAHAMRLWSHEHPVEDAYWFKRSNNLVCLSVPNEAALLALAGRLRKEGILFSAFREPDFDNAVTAIAVEPAGARFLSSVPLALKKAA